MKILSLILSILLIQSIYSAAEEDKVNNLPDYSYNGTLYSGYLNVSETKKFHYFFNLAKNDTDNKKPLILWLNGGPGCSSLDGWATEHGPMLMDDNGKFQLNNYSWVNEANMIYLESPGGVGFSYINSNSSQDLYTDDNTTANDNLQALLSFFKKFPEQKNKDFYISGESYAGIYVPTLAYKVLEHNKNVTDAEKINLKGILVGNGVADWKYDAENAMLDFFFTHHLISYEDRLEYVKYCLTNATLNATKCEKIVNDTVNFVLDGINFYDYLRECKVPKNLRGEINTNSKYYLNAPWIFERFKTTDEKLTTLKEESEGAEIACIDDTHIQNYFSRADVQTALHINPQKKWYVCSNTVSKRYNRTTIGSIWTYPTLIKEKLKILIYSGDTDLAVPFNGNLLWIRDLKLKTEEAWRSWRVDNDTNNVAGYVVKYEGLTFCTIKGTGHMAPGWKPKEVHYMFSKFLKGEKF